MKSSRKVQAQRKFAQGAHAPAAATTSGAFPERKPREPTKGQHLVKVQVPASVLLDVVSFKNVHLHVQPVVLIERLKTSNITNNNVIVKKTVKVQKVTPNTHIVKEFKKKKPNKNQKSMRGPYPWDMTLRSRNTRNEKKVPLTKQVRKRRGAQEQMQGNFKRSRVICRENFTSDDNKPLTHFAKVAVKRNALKKNSKSLKATKNVMTRDKTKDDSGLKTAAPGLRKGRSKNAQVPELVDASLQSDNQGLADKTSISAPQTPVTNDNYLNLTTSKTVVLKSKKAVLDRDCESQAETVLDQLAELVAVPEPQPGPSGLQAPPPLGAAAPAGAPAGPDAPSDLPDTSECGQLRGFSVAENDAAVPYYNEHGIQRWINVFLSTPDPAANNRLDVDLVDCTTPTLTTMCPATAWSTLREVVNAPPQLLSTRCTECEACTRIAKVFQLSILLRVHRQIVRNDDEEQGPEPAAPLPGDDNTMVSTDGGLFMELLPSHPNFMIKLKAQSVHSKQILSVRLCPRRDAQFNKEFHMMEHEYIVDDLITAATLNSPPPQPVAGNLNGPESDPRPASVKADSVVDLTSRCSVRSEGRSDAGSQPNSFPKSVDRAKLVDAPVFYPTKEEFTDPIAYFEKIAPVASKYGLCKVIPPPSHEFTPKCKIDDNIRFDVTNQYISRLYNRWGPAARELCAIKACLKSQFLNLTRSPLLDGIEVNLPKLYHVVQRNGGLEKVIDKKRWGRVAEEMSFTKTPNPEKKLDNIYVKYLLPYDTLAHKERQEIIRKVEKHWNKRNQKMLDRAMNPLHRQKRLLGESDSSGEDTGDESEVGNALAEAEDCIVPGSCMNLSKFKRVATIALENNFRSSTVQSAQVVEDLYWRLVLLGTEHVCVNTASIDTGEEGYGFSKNKQDPYSQHPWNLKILSQNSSNMLRSLGPVLGLTVPSLHLCMVFSTSCWHSDPHGLPWIEYMHQGSTKIWYGIPYEQSQNFRKAVETLCPTSCQNKAIWLPSDITMIPPPLLLEHNVSLSKVAQNPGEFIMVYPKAYSCSISTGYTLSESVYFATHSWLNSVHLVFQELRESCEPTMFSLEQLLLAVALDERTPHSVLRHVHDTLGTIVADEARCREQLRSLGLPAIEDKNREHVDSKRRRNTSAWNVRDLDECEVCRMTLYLSKVSGLSGRRSSVCLLHALRLLECRAAGTDVAGLQLVLYVPIEDLNITIEKVERRLVMGDAGDERGTTE